jgi:hypothetical protein
MISSVRLVVNAFLYKPTHSFCGKKWVGATRRNNYCDTDTKAMQEADGDDTFEKPEELKKNDAGAE